MGVLVKKGACEQTDYWGINELCERMKAELSGCPGKEGEVRAAQPAGYGQRLPPHLLGRWEALDKILLNQQLPAISD